jgi:hypothetical protein
MLGWRAMRETLMAWRIEGTYFENCPCDMVCPCTTSGLTHPADAERCRVVFAFHVDRGEIEGVDVSDRSVVLVVDAPRLMTDGQWRAGVVMDAAASPEQAAGLGAVFGGQAGGPMAALAPLIGEMLGVESAPIEYVDDGLRHSVRAGDLVDIEVEDYIPPQLRPNGAVEKLVNVFSPVNSTLTVASATRSRVSAFGMDFSHDGKNGHSAPFSWSS